MGGLAKIKIQKTKYSFDVKKKYSYEKPYKVVKKPPAELLKEWFKGLFAPKQKTAAAPHKAVEKKPSAPTFNPFIVGAAIIFAIILLGAVAFVLSMQGLGTEIRQVVPSFEKPVVSNAIFDGEIVTSNDRYVNMNSGFVGLRYNASDLDNYTAYVYTFDKNLYSEVFLLESDVEDEGDYSNFVVALRTELGRYGLMLNEISIQDLESLPASAVVIVPSGYLPEELLGGGGSQITPSLLASRGVVVVYVGRPFSKVYSKGIVINTPPEIRKNIPFDFDERAQLSSSGISLYQPLYSVSGSGWESFLTSGSVSVLTKGEGGFVFFPQSLSGGWRADPLNAAEDIAKVILEAPWAKADGSPKTYSLEPTAASISLLTNEFKGTAKSVLVVFEGKKRVGDQEIVVHDREVARIKKKVRGNLYISPSNSIIPSSISGQNVRMYVALAEPQAQQVSLRVLIINGSNSIFTSFPLGRLSTQSEKEVDIALDPPKGEYKVLVVDDAGNAYAASYLSVSSIQVNFLGKGRSPSVYRFSVTMNGKPTQLTQVVVSVDGGKHGVYTYASVVTGIDVDTKQYTGGDALPPGNHSFEFKVGELTETYYIYIPVPQLPFFDDPIFLGAIVFSLLIVAASLIFARKEEARFFIDIPDFPPLAREKISLSPEVILSLFEKVNTSYHWRHTPLKLSEIKSGFKDIYYKGKPIYVIDYNVESILHKMKSHGKIVQFLDYYAPVSWEEATKRNIKYLVLIRALRDICINNATPFTGLGESDKADSEIDVMGQKMFVHFYYQEADLAALFKKIFANAGEGINIILFENETEKGKFRKILASPTKPQLIMKLEVESSAIQLLTISELEKMIKELRSI